MLEQIKTSATKINIVSGRTTSEVKDFLSDLALNSKLKRSAFKSNPTLEVEFEAVMKLLLQEEPNLPLVKTMNEFPREGTSRGVIFGLERKIFPCHPIMQVPLAKAVVLFQILYGVPLILGTTSTIFAQAIELNAILYGVEKRCSFYFVKRFCSISVCQPSSNLEDNALEEFYQWFRDPLTEMALIEERIRKETFEAQYNAEHGRKFWNFGKKREVIDKS